MHQAALVGHINAFNPLATGMIHQANGIFGQPDASGGSAGLAMIYALVRQQAAILSYLDIFQIFSIIILLVVPIVFLMRRGAVSQEAAVAH
jgi:hypothetical protein